MIFKDKYSRKNASIHSIQTKRVKPGQILALGFFLLDDFNNTLISLDTGLISLQKDQISSSSNISVQADQISVLNGFALMKNIIIRMRSRGEILSGNFL